MIRQCDGKRMQHQSPMRIENSFGLACCARGVAHSRSLIFIESRVLHRLAVLPDPRLVVLAAFGQRATSVAYYKHALKLCLCAYLLVNGQQDIVNNQEPVLRMIRDVRELVRMQAEIQCMQNSSGARDPKIRFKVGIVIPHQRGHALASLQPEPLQSTRKRSGTRCNIAVSLAMNRVVREPRNDLDLWE